MLSKNPPRTQLLYAKKNNNLFSYAAFLRGIGPGDPKKSNQSLCSVLTTLGFSHVRSFLSSGNILFDSEIENIEQLELMIERAYQDQLGIKVPTFVRSQSDIEIFLNKNIFGKSTHSRATYLTVTMVKKNLIKEAKRTARKQFPGVEIISFDSSFDALCVIIDTLNAKTTDYMTWLEREIGKNITTRTQNTLERTLKKMKLENIGLL